MTRTLRQVSFDDRKPDPFAHIAIINRTMESLAKGHGFTPVCVVEDGLGWVSYVPLELDDGTRFVLDWAEGANPEQAVVQADVTDRPYATALDKLLAALRLDRSAVLCLADDEGYAHQIEWLKREGRLL